MRLAVPNKGRLHDPSVNLLERAGLEVSNSRRELYADTSDPEITVVYARAGDVPEYVAEGAADAGITGLDQVKEARANLEPLLDLEFGRCTLCLASPKSMDVNDPKELEGKKIATEFPNTTQDYFEENNINVEIAEVEGATEATPRAGMADAIVDLVSTGATLRANNLEIIEEILESSVYLFARPDALDEGNKITEIRTALESVVKADGKRYLMMNVPKDSLNEVREAAPGLSGPTVLPVKSGEDENIINKGIDKESGLVAVHAVVDENEVYDTVNKVKNAGAKDILVTPIERLVK